MTNFVSPLMLKSLRHWHKAYLVKQNAISPLILKNEPMEYVSKWTYLGVTIVAGVSLSFTCKGNCQICTALSIHFFPRFRSQMNLVLMTLLYSNCVPCLSYAAEVKDLSSSEMNNCNVALNDSIRRIFSYNRWESTRTLRQQLGFQNISEMFHSRRDSFLSQCLKLRNRNQVVFSLASSLTNVD